MSKHEVEKKLFLASIIAVIATENKKIRDAGTFFVSSTTILNSCPTV
jgi:hypothetical protein